MADCNFSLCYPFADSFISGKTQCSFCIACKALFLHIYCAVFLWPEGNRYWHGFTVFIGPLSPENQPELCCCDSPAVISECAGVGMRCNFVTAIYPGNGQL